MNRRGAVVREISDDLGLGSGCGSVPGQDFFDIDARGVGVDDFHVSPFRVLARVLDRFAAASTTSHGQWRFYF